MSSYLAVQGEFPRQGKTTSSVRLRRRKDDVCGVGGRKKERHSGDFCYFSTRREESESVGEGGARVRVSHLASTKEVMEENTKQCSGEFEFRKVERRSRDMSDPIHGVWGQVLEGEERLGDRSVTSQVMGVIGVLGDTGSEDSEESGIFSLGTAQELSGNGSRKPGLGRRAVTQMCVREKKAWGEDGRARSQEDLVKLNSAGGADAVFDDDSRTIKKGLLWQQRDKLFSRWKERYFILTKDFLQCFKKGTSRITEMGDFIFKIKLSDVDMMELLDKKGYLTICISLQREGKVFLRRTEGIRDWYDAILENMEESKRRRKNRASAIFADRSQNTETSGGGMESWVLHRHLTKTAFSDSTPEVTAVVDKERITLDELSKLYKEEEMEEVRRRKDDAANRLNKRNNRLSLLSTSDPDPDLAISLEKGIFLRRNLGDTDSGHNSLHSSSTGISSSTGTASSKLSQPAESSFVEEEEEEEEEIHSVSPEVRIKNPAVNRSVIEVRYRERGRRDGGSSSHRPQSSSFQSQATETEERQCRSHHVNRLQITHV